MAKPFALSHPVEEPPLSNWRSLAVETLGCETFFVDGKRWRHRVMRFGKGDPLVLIHGGGGHCETWARNMHKLGEHFNVYAIDALYHGLSSKEPYDDVARHDLQAEAIIDLLDGLGHDWAHIEGESMGAWVAFDVAMRYPDRVGKAIFNTGIGRVDLGRTEFADTGHDFKELARLSGEAILHPSFETVMARMQWLLASPDRMTDEMVDLRLRLYAMPDVELAMKRYFKIGQNAKDIWNLDPIWSQEDVKQRLKAPSLVFWTEHNPGEGPDMGEWFADVIGAQFYLMRDAAHWPQWEKPVEHDEVVIQFLKS